jgi:hypothetical protein
MVRIPTLQGGSKMSDIPIAVSSEIEELATEKGRLLYNLERLAEALREDITEAPAGYYSLAAAYCRYQIASERFQRFIHDYMDRRITY